MCVYCDMKPHRSGRLEWLQGDDYTEGYVTAHIANERGFGWLLYVQERGWDETDDTQTVSVSIANCPWCGRRLEGTSDVA